jgi:hypothetical protein
MMRTSDLALRPGFSLAQGKYEDRELSGGYTSDLLSDVMGNAAEGNVLVTIQAHKNTVAVASLVGIAAIVICNNRSLPEDMVEAAASEGIAILQTGASQFEVSGRLWPELARP